jgi:hypothetical protein
VDAPRRDLVDQSVGVDVHEIEAIYSELRPREAAANRRTDGALLHIVCENIHTHDNAADQVTTTLWPARGGNSVDDIGSQPGTQRVAIARLDNDTTNCIEVDSRLRGMSPLAVRCEH